MARNLWKDFTARYKIPHLLLFERYDIKRYGISIYHLNYLSEFHDGDQKEKKKKKKGILS
jgi:hypothetical protein